MINTEFLTSNGAALDTGAPAPAQETRKTRKTAVNGATAVGTANIAVANANVANVANKANVAGKTRVDAVGSGGAVNATGSVGTATFTKINLNTHSFSFTSAGRAGRAGVTGASGASGASGAAGTNSSSPYPDDPDEVDTRMNVSNYYKQNIRMLTNERYAGDIQLQKSYVENHITHKLVPNDCTKIASYYIENHHVPIISHKQFRRVNEIREMRGGKPRSLHFLSNDDRASSIGSGRIRTLRSASGGSGSGGFCTFSDSGYLRWPNQYPFGSKLRCPFCGAILRQQQFMQYSTGLKSRIYAGLYCTENPSNNAEVAEATEATEAYETETDIAVNGSTDTALDTASAASTGSTCCHNFIIPSSFVLKAILDAYRDLNIPKVRTKLDSPKFHRAAVTMLSMKTKHKTFSKVDYWWLDDLVDHIEFGRHSYTQSEIDKMKAAGDEFIDDRVIRIFWRCGIVSTVPSGVKNDKDDPQYLVERYQNYLKKQAAKAIADKALTEVVETGMTEVTSTVSKVGTNAVGSRRAAGAVRAVKTVGASS